MIKKRISLDGAERRRLYLFRHGAVDYVDKRGQVVADPDAVELNRKGLEQTDAMRELFSKVAVDRAICSGLHRTRETAERVLAGRKVEIEVERGLEEIRPARDYRPDPDLVNDVAFSHWRAGDDESRFLGGERYADFYRRISTALERILDERDWHNLALFGHGGTNAAILGWVTGLGLAAFGVVDQATCCLNVIDLDFDPDQHKILRKVVRGMNITVDDPTKSRRDAGDMEALASYLMRFVG